MTNSYTRVGALARCLRQLGLATLLISGVAVAAQAQTLNYATSTATNTTTTYADLGTTGTAISTANTDDANSAAQNIGFTFSYNGASFTQFVFNTNGVVRLGSAAPSTAALYYDDNTDGTATDPLQSTNAADVNLLMPFNFDLVPGSAAAGVDYRVLTSGTAPNRVCTIQWRNVADKPGAGSDIGNVTQYANFSFQLKLYETSNLVEFVYGTAVAGSGAAGARFPNVGLKGSGLSTGQVLLGLKAAQAAWSTTTFQNSNYTNSAHNITKSVVPTAGRTYRFATAPPNDAAVKNIYTLGKLATSTALPHAVQAVVANTGTTTQTNLIVTLNVTGANTFTDTKTVASLAAGTSRLVTFASYPATLNIGTNTVTISLPSDGNATNNTANYGQLVTADRVSYTDPTVALVGGIGLGSAIFASKYTLPAATVISDVVLTFAPTPTTAPNTAPFQIVVYDAAGTDGLPGQALYTSDVQNRTAAGGVQTVALPNVPVSASFYIAVKEASATNIGLGYQLEDPIRPTTFYLSINNGTSWIDFSGVTPQARVAVEFGTIIPSCAAPTAVTVSNTTPTSATVTFTPTATGTTSYQVLYGPAGFNPVSGGATVTATSSPVTLTGLTPGTTYQIYVRSNCTAGGTSVFTAPVTFATACDPNPLVSAFPYNQNFDTVLPGQALPCGITVLDANNDGAKWAINKTAPFSGSNALRYASALANSQAADDWFFTPPLSLAANTRYQLAFRYRAEGIANSPSNFTEKLEVKAGPTNTPAGQTTTLFTNAAITNTSYAQAGATSAPVVALLQPGAGTQYVGFHVYSAAEQGNLYIDDISITSATGLLATSPALLRAITVFPNPSTTGVFDLEIHGANAQRGLDVEVINNLGQRVYVGTARDNFTNHLDLSNLATGLYHLQVRTGTDYLLRQLAIVR